MGPVLAFIEQKGGAPRGSAAEVLTAARTLADALGTTCEALLVGAPGLSAAAGDAGRWGATRVRVAEHAELETVRPEAYAAVVAEAVRSAGARAVVFAASATGKDLAPRVAALLDVPLAQDVTEIAVDGGNVHAVRPVYAGKAFQRVQLQAEPALLTLRPNSVPAQEHTTEAAVETFTPEVPDAALRTRVVGFEAAAGDAVDVAEASIVVSGGRGMRGPEHWPLLEALVAALGSEAGLGASRAVVDAGWRPHGEQVGQTGKTVSPRLYIAAGISGAIQHLAGMRTAGTIVAINKDADAPIFQVADYGIVGDLFEVLPRLTEEVARLRTD
ncbi:MAG: electron transfer flavoprotein subunit alpha/FixB family protein [Gemmatimonadota bacterium]